MKKGSIIPGLIILGLYLLWIVHGFIIENNENPFFENWKMYLDDIHFLAVVIFGLIILYPVERTYNVWNTSGVWIKVVELFSGYFIISLMIYFSLPFFGIYEKYLNTDIEGTIFMGLIPMLVINSAIIIIGGVIYSTVSILIRLIKKYSNKSYR